jgi:hypothetical protein
VSDGKTLWIYDPTAKEVQEFAVGQGFLSGTAVQFLLGEGRILDAFTVRAERCTGDEVRLFLTPREEASYESLELLVAPGSGDVKGTAVVDLFGNRTDVTFESLVVNRHPAAARFQFQAEPGVRVLRANEPAGAEAPTAASGFRQLRRRSDASSDTERRAPAPRFLASLRIASAGCEAGTTRAGIRGFALACRPESVDTRGTPH